MTVRPAGPYTRKGTFAPLCVYVCLCALDGSSMGDKNGKQEQTDGSSTVGAFGQDKNRFFSLVANVRPILRFVKQQFDGWDDFYMQIWSYCRRQPLHETRRLCK